MFRRQRSGSVLCPSCGQLVGVNDAECLGCGRKRPGLWGLAGLFRAGRFEDALGPFLMWTCGVVYLATLAVDPSGIGGGGMLNLASPGGLSLLRFGAAGAGPVFELHRWWTPLSAGWLHGGLPHIAFNVMALRVLARGTVELYGVARTVLVYVASSVAGFLASSSVGYFLPLLPWPLSGSDVTIGASASVFGLCGAILYYGRRSGSSLIRTQATQWIMGGLLFGVLIRGIDNWAHVGGLAGGYLAGMWLDPLKPERGDHAILAAIALLVSLGAVVLSLLVPIPFGLIG